jgi:hypothetical protein
MFESVITDGVFYLFAEPEFLEEFSLHRKMLYLIMATTVCRFKYYHAWLLADAICNASGLGFNGYDAKGRARWDLISNVDVFRFEVSFARKYMCLLIVIQIATPCSGRNF